MKFDDTYLTFLWGNNTLLMGFPVLKPGESFQLQKKLTITKNLFEQGLLF